MRNTWSQTGAEVTWSVNGYATHTGTLVGDHTIVGMDSMVLTHEFLHDRFRHGRVRIGATDLSTMSEKALTKLESQYGRTPNENELAGAWEKLGGVPLILEQFIEFVDSGEGLFGGGNTGANKLIHLVFHARWDGHATAHDDAGDVFLL